MHALTPVAKTENRMNSEALRKLRLVITENLPVQRGGAEKVPYIDVSNALSETEIRSETSMCGCRG